MSYYYKYNFVSPEPIYAEVKEELKSYFDTGIVDDILFTRYTEDCLKRLGRSSYKIVPNVFNLNNYTVQLPDDFEAVRELWLCTSHEQSYQLPEASYHQTTCRITPVNDRCNPCDTDSPEVIKITYKTTGEEIQRFTKQFLLRPGNINAKNQCSLDCMNYNSSVDETFDIRDGKIITNFPQGTLYMTYYVKEYDDNDFQLVPDNVRILDYLKAYLKYKCFETIYNSITDETFKQAESKMLFYKKEADFAKVIAETEIKKQTIDQIRNSIKSQRNRFRNFKIS